MRYDRLNRAGLRKAYDNELALYHRAIDADERRKAWAHLERAHILSQRYLTRHWRTHWLMLRMARQDRCAAEVRGQIRRLAAVPLGWIGGWVPKGNTGGSDVHPLKPMVVTDDLAEALRGYSPWKDVALRIIWLVAALLAVLWARAAWAEVRELNGESLSIAASADAHCQLVAALVGAEDIILDREAGSGFAVGGDRRAFRGGGEGRSRVFFFPVDDPMAARDVTPDKPAELKGFGADLLRDDDGTVWLGIANRSTGGHAIEVYSVEEDGTLTHQRTLTAPDFRNPNDLLLMTPDSAIVTLDKRAKAGSVWEIVEGVRRAETGRVVRLEAGRMETVADGLLSSNGIVRLEDGRLVVGELVGRRVSVYAENATGDDAATSYQLQRRISLPFAVDNLSSHDGRTVWAAGHPKLLTLARGYQRNEADRSPSKAAELDPVTGSVETIFEDDGAFLSASSVAVKLPDGRLLLGTAFGPAAALCDGPS